jgi:8-oxo-dGTP pyrophosphatase MutT (NUDIX family)
MLTEVSIGARVIVLDDDGKVLLVQHRHDAATAFWVPPGGGLEPGETFVDCAIREVREETGLDIEVQRFIFLDEAYVDGVHSLGAWFLARPVAGEIVLGMDPELDKKQILADVRFVSPADFPDLGKVYPEPEWWDSLWMSMTTGMTFRSYAIARQGQSNGDYVRTGWL